MVVAVAVVGGIHYDLIGSIAHQIQLIVAEQWDIGKGAVVLAYVYRHWWLPGTGWVEGLP